MIEERDTLLDIEDNIARQFGDQYVQLATGLMKAHIINSSDTHSLFDIDFDM